MTRISSGTLIVGIFAVLFGLVAVYVIRRELQPKPTPEPEPVAEERPLIVPLAAIDLVAGRPLKMGDVALVRMTRDQIKERNLPVEYMSNPQQIIGRIPRVALTKGQAFTTEALYPEGLAPSVAERLQEGYRAVTVSIHDIGAVAGFAVPGSMVDVLFRSEADEDQEIPETTVTLLEGVEVLALDANRIEGSDRLDDVTTVTLAVTPGQAGILKVVEGRGELSLAIRSPEDAVLASNAESLTLSGLLGVEKKPAPFRAEIYNGSSRQTLIFENQQVIEEHVSGLGSSPAVGGTFNTGAGRLAGAGQP